MSNEFTLVVADASVNSVFITSESGFLRLSFGGKTPWSIGVLLRDLYEYDSKSLPEKLDWKQMTNWTPKLLCARRFCNCCKP